MNKRQIEVQKHIAGEETKVIQELKEIYRQASGECADKIKELSMRTDMANLQSIVWQKQYQEALKKQIDGVVDILNTNSFSKVSDYLGEAYENGFFGTLYDLQGQGIPLILPINQEEVVKALQIDSKISQGLYKRMGEDTDQLKKAIRTELSIGTAGGKSWNQIAANIAMGMNSPFTKAFNRATTIARTEGHRVTQEATFHCQQKAKSKGADVMKQWDSTLDKSTRRNHVELDGQLRELEDTFEIAGKGAMYPGGFGDPAEDCNCRCCVLQRAKWALTDEEYYKKWDGDKDKLVKIQAKNYNDFKEQAKATVKLNEYRMMDFDSRNPNTKAKVTFFDAFTDMPQNVKDAIIDTRIVTGSNGSYYDSAEDIIYVGAKATKNEIIHEIGHSVENKLFDKEKIDFIKQRCVSGLKINDLEFVKAYDSSGNEVNVFLLKSDKFITAYQGRMYIDSWEDAVNRDGTININSLQEFISEGFQEYFKNKGKLKSKNYELFALIDEVIGK